MQNADRNSQMVMASGEYDSHSINSQVSSMFEYQGLSEIFIVADRLQLMLFVSNFQGFDEECREVSKIVEAFDFEVEDDNVVHIAVEDTDNDEGIVEYKVVEVEGFDRDLVAVVVGNT